MAGIVWQELFVLCILLMTLDKYVKGKIFYILDPAFTREGPM